MFEELHGMRIAWIIPSVNRGAGGLQTIFRHVSFLQSKGALCEIHMTPGFAPQTQSELSKLLASEYGCTCCTIHATFDDSIRYDAVIATMWLTVPYALRIPAQHRFYFVQDYEPWFYPMGDDYLDAAKTYEADIIPITIGRWLSNTLKTNHGKEVRFTDFCADQSIYYPLGLSYGQKECAICAVYQPDKPRRCTKLLVDSLSILHQLDPSITIYTFGTANPCPELVNSSRHLGILSKDGCNDLYNRCLAGLSLSTSNPSRIPFEMMAAGLPTVDLYRENNFLDLGCSPAILATPSPDAIASALFDLVRNEQFNTSVSAAELQFMSDRPIILEAEQFASALCEDLHAGSDDTSHLESSSSRTGGYEALKQAHDLYRNYLDEQIDQAKEVQSAALERRASEMNSQPEHSVQNDDTRFLRRIVNKMKRILLD